VFSKLYSLVCVYVHFKIQGATKKALVTNLVKIIWQTSNYKLDNMSNLHKLQWHTIIVQMNYHCYLLNEKSNESEGENN
jgi:hypothetical protein